MALSSGSHPVAIFARLARTQIEGMLAAGNLRRHRSRLYS